VGGTTASYICLHLGKSNWNYQNHQKLVRKWSKPPATICCFSSHIFVTQYAFCYSFSSSISTPEPWKFRLQACEVDHVVVSGELEILINYTTHPLILNYHFTLVYQVLYYVDLNLCVWTSFCLLVQWYQFSYVLQKKYLFYLNIMWTLEENMFHLPVFFQLQFFERHIGCSKFHWVVVLHIAANWNASPQGFQFFSGDGSMVGLET